MLERFQYLVMYLGSAATVAFMAASLSAPRVATYTCDSSGFSGTQHCELSATLPAADPEAGMQAPAHPTPNIPSRQPTTVTTSR